MVRNIELGLTHLLVFHSFIFFSFLVLGFFRKKTQLKVKLYSIASLYNFVGLVGLYNFGFSGGHYYVLVGISVLAILEESTFSRIYIVVVILIYLVLSVLFEFTSLEPKLGELDVLNSKLHQMALLLATVSLSLIYIFGFGHYYKLLSITVKEKAVAEKKLGETNQELEQRVESRTEELSYKNDELSIKNEIIKEKNEELISTLNKLKQTHYKMLESDKMASLGILTAGVAHEINNPLNYISGAYEGLKDYFNENELKNEETAQLLGFLKEGLSKSSEIVESLNNFSRKNSSKNEEYQVDEIIDNCLRILQFSLNNKVSIIKNFQHDRTKTYGNVGQLHQVFMNILTNANHACGAKGEIEISTHSTERQLVVEITDSGCGIEKEKLNKLIEPFYTTKGPGKGTGLGLYITYNIIKEHNGFLEFESEVGKGTTVKVSLNHSLDQKE